MCCVVVLPVLYAYRARATVFLFRETAVSVLGVSKELRRLILVAVELRMAVRCDICAAVHRQVHLLMNEKIG